MLLKDTNYQRWKILSQKYKKIKQVPLDEVKCHKKKSYFMSLKWHKNLNLWICTYYGIFISLEIIK